MGKRLTEAALKNGSTGFGREICRNCGGAIQVDAADHRNARMPHRRVCRECGTEYGTTAATLYPSRSTYDP